jgi:predicted AAA+ superfamily ATPase
MSIGPDRLQIDSTPLAGPRSGEALDLDGQAFRLYGRLYLIDPGARLSLATWRERTKLEMGDLGQLVRLLDSFIDYHLTRHGRELWRLDRSEGGPITLHDLWEVTYLIDPAARVTENRSQRRSKR